MGTTLLILDDGNEHRGDRSNQLFGLISPTQADRLAAGGFVAPDRRRTQSLVRTSRGVKRFYKMRKFKMWRKRGTQEAGVAERGGQDSSNCSLR